MARSSSISNPFFLVCVVGVDKLTYNFSERKEKVILVLGIYVFFSFFNSPLSFSQENNLNNTKKMHFYFYVLKIFYKKNYLFFFKL